MKSKYKTYFIIIIFLGLSYERNLSGDFNKNIEPVIDKYNTLSHSVVLDEEITYSDIINSQSLISQNKKFHDKIKKSMGEMPEIDRYLHVNSRYNFKFIFFNKAIILLDSNDSMYNLFHYGSNDEYLFKKRKITLTNKDNKWYITTDSFYN